MVVVGVSGDDGISFVARTFKFRLEVREYQYVGRAILFCLS